MLEELQMKIIHSHEEVRADIGACQETTGAWDQPLSKFYMELWCENESGERIKFQVDFEQKMETRLKDWQLLSENTRPPTKIK